MRTYRKYALMKFKVRLVMLSKFNLSFASVAIRSKHCLAFLNLDLNILFGERRERCVSTICLCQTSSLK